jgi:methyltransferase
MRWAYPGAFVAMGIEGGWWGADPGVLTTAGLAVFVAAKALKFWAIASLGRRWSYGVMVLPGQPLVESGPYRWLRHPNYVAVVGELIGMALLVGARVTGPVATMFFGSLLWRRIAAEERAIRPPATKTT